jgi:hypothetical protein
MQFLRRPLPTSSTTTSTNHTRYRSGRLAQEETGGGGGGGGGEGDGGEEEEDGGGGGGHERVRLLSSASSPSLISLDISSSSSPSPSSISSPPHLHSYHHTNGLHTSASGSSLPPLYHPPSTSNNHFPHVPSLSSLNSAVGGGNRGYSKVRSCICYVSVAILLIVWLLFVIRIFSVYNKMKKGIITHHYLLSDFTICYYMIRYDI